MLKSLSLGAWVSTDLPLLQHQTFDAFCAVQTGNDLLRVSAHGPSTLIDPTGTVHTLFDAQAERARVVKVR